MKRWIKSSIQALEKKAIYTISKAPSFRGERLNNWIGETTQAVSEKQAINQFKYRILQSMNQRGQNNINYYDIEFPAHAFTVKYTPNRQALEVEREARNYAEEIEPEVSDEYAFEENDLDD